MTTLEQPKEPRFSRPAFLFEKQESVDFPMEYNGQKFTISVDHGKGWHAKEAARRANGDQHEVNPILMAMLVRIDGTYMAVEDWNDLPLNLFTEIFSKFQDVNFTILEPEKPHPERPS